MKIYLQRVLLAFIILIVPASAHADNEKFYNYKLEPITSISLPSSWQLLTIDPSEGMRVMAKKKFDTGIEDNLKINVIIHLDKSFKIYFAIIEFKTFKNGETTKVSDDELKN